MITGKKIVIIGANGQLGSQLMVQFQENNQVYGLTHKELEISEPDMVLAVLSDISPDIIINTAAYHNVPKCEEDPELSFRINALGALNLARVTEKMDATLVHYGTDYVFDGKKHKPYVEDDMTNPLNIYALTKRDGETLVQNNCKKHYVIRISGIYGSVACRAKGGNFITTMIKAARERDVVRVVTDEILTPTPVSEIANNTAGLIDSGKYGLYHMTCEGHCSWYEFATVIFEKLKLTTPLEPCKVEDFPSSVPRPIYSVLENKKLKQNDLNKMNHWKDALITFLDQNYSN